jgi:hypothetical protein
VKVKPVSINENRIEDALATPVVNPYKHCSRWNLHWSPFWEGEPVMKVKEIMTANSKACTTTTNLAEAA